MCSTFLACAAVRDDLRRASEHYNQARYENALVWLEELESDAPSMHRAQRTRYFYLRGMTEFRLGRRAEALHYLAVAREVAGERVAGERVAGERVAGERTVGLGSREARLMTRVLAELTPDTRTYRPRDPSASQASN